MLRLLVLSGALWAAAAATLALILALTVALPVEPPLATLGVGRLHGAARFLWLHGGLSLPLAAALLAAAGPTTPASRARAGTWLWNGGLLAGVLAVLGVGAGPAPWLSAPPLARALVWVGMLLWTSELLSALGRRASPPPVGLWLGVSGAVGLLVYQGVGLLASLLGDTGSVVALALAARGLFALWLVPAGWGVAALVLPRAAGRPLFGRRVALAALWLWPLTAAPAVARDLAPDLLPIALHRLADAAVLLTAVPAVLLGVLVLGVFVGRGETTWYLDQMGAGGIGRLALAGLLLWLPALLADAALGPGTRALVRLTALEPSAALLPPLAGPLLVASAAGALALWHTGLSLPAPVLRWQLVLAGAGGLLLALPLLVLGPTELLLGPGGELLTLGLVVRLPGAGIVWLATLLWLVGCWRVMLRGMLVAGADGGRPTASARTPLVGEARGPQPLVLAGGTLVVLVGALFITLFLPLATQSGRSSAPITLPGGLRAEGRARYVAEGCVACHTQRARTLETVADLSLRGRRRAGPDLAAVGARYPDRSAMRGALAAHVGGPAPGYPWLLDEAGPSARGRAVIDYLLALGAPRAASAEADR